MTRPLEAVIFDIGNTLVHAAPPGTPAAGLAGQPIGEAIADLWALSIRYRLAAVTDTSVMTAADVRAALDRSGFAGLLDPIATSADVGAAKPDPRGLRWVLEQLDVAPEAAVFVGDAQVDRGAAEAAGVAFIQADGSTPILELVERFVASRNQAGRAATDRG